MIPDLKAYKFDFIRELSLILKCIRTRALQSGQLHGVPGGHQCSECCKHKQSRIIIEPAPSHPGNCNISCFRELMILSWSYVGGRSGAGLQGAPQACHIAPNPHCFTTTSQHQQLCKFRKKQRSFIYEKALHFTLFQLKEKTRAGNVFLVPVDHTESDNLHIQVTTLHPNHSPTCPCKSEYILISRETITFIFILLLLFMTRALSDD